MPRPTATFVLASVLSLSAAAQHGPQSEPQATVQQPRLTLTLGVYSWKKPTEVVRDLAPANEELMRLMELETGRKTLITLRVFKTYDECLDKFVAGEVDLVRFGPASYVLAKRSNPDVQLLAAEQEDGKKRCKGVIVVRKDSPVKTLEDLKGRTFTFAFGDENSTIGRYLSQAKLVEKGVHAEDLKYHKYLERHDKVFKAVEIGDYDAGALHEGPFEDLNQKGQLREIARFDNAGKPWVARAHLDPQVVTALRKALLAMTAEVPLQALKVHGFLPTCDQDYDVVRAGMKLAEQFVRTPQPGVSPAQVAPAPHGGKG